MFPSPDLETAKLICILSGKVGGMVSHAAVIVERRMFRVSAFIVFLNIPLATIFPIVCSAVQSGSEGWVDGKRHAIRMARRLHPGFNDLFTTV